MDNQLTERQRDLLRATVEDYIEEAEPVGSKVLVEEHKFDFSPATARNELAQLAKEGFLRKPYTSGGRIPTTLGFRFYIKNLLRGEELPVLEEVSLKQRIWPYRHETFRLLREAAKALADAARALGMVLREEDVFYGGAVNLLDYSEFMDINVTRTVLHLLDRRDLLWEILEKGSKGDEVGVLLGEELGLASLKPCGLVFRPFTLGREKGMVAVLGPNRLPYGKVIPVVDYVGKLLSEMEKW